MFKVNIVKLGIQAIFILFLFITCDSTPKSEVGANKSKDEKVGLYIYDGESNIPRDSLVVFISSFEKSLELYKNINEIEKEVAGLVYFSVFQLNDQRFAIIVDTTTIKVFKFNDNKCKLLLTDSCMLGVNGIKREEIDVNSDGYKDVLLEIPSGGTFGSAFFCLFYEPSLKKLVCDTNIELRNIELNIGKGQVISYSSLTCEKYSIDEFRLRLSEQVIYLGKTTGNIDLEDQIEVSKFNSYGILTQKDTMNNNKYFR